MSIDLYQVGDNLRNLATIKWYIIPLLSIVFYIYTIEIKNARISKNWDAVFAGLTVLGMDSINETWNGWVYANTGHAFWTTPGSSALQTMVGWNIEIIFMFSILGIVFYHSIGEDKNKKILGLPEPLFLAICFSLFSVFTEVLLNMGGHLLWWYPFWNRSFGGVWLIFFFGYFHFFVATILVLNLKTIQGKVKAVASLYAIAIIMNIFGMGIMGWKY